MNDEIKNNNNNDESCNTSTTTYYDQTKEEEEEENSVDCTLLLDQLLLRNSNTSKNCHYHPEYTIDSNSIYFRNHPDIDNDQAAKRLGDALLQVYNNNNNENSKNDVSIIEELYITIHQLSECTYVYESLLQFIETTNNNNTIIKQITLDGNGDYTNKIIVSTIVIERFLAAIERSTAIQYVELIGCKNINLYTFASLIHNTQSINDLNIDHYAFTREGKENKNQNNNNNSNDNLVIAQAFIMNKTLKRFYMEITERTIPIALNILNYGIRNNTHLQHLVLEWSPQQDDTNVPIELSHAIHNAISPLSSSSIQHLELRYFEFHNNNDNDNSFQPIGDAIRNNTTIQKLSLQCCTFENDASIQLEHYIKLRDQPLHELAIIACKLFHRNDNNNNNNNNNQVVLEPFSTLSNIILSNQVEQLQLDIIKIADDNVRENYMKTLITDFMTAVECSKTLTSLSMDFIKNELFEVIVKCIPRIKYLKELNLHFLLNDDKYEVRKLQLNTALRKNSSLIEINISPRGIIDDIFINKITKRNMWLQQWQKNNNNNNEKNNYYNGVGRNNNNINNLQLLLTPMAFYHMQQCTYGIQWTVQHLIMLGDDII